MHAQHCLAVFFVCNRVIVNLAHVNCITLKRKAEILATNSQHAYVLERGLITNTFHDNVMPLNARKNVKIGVLFLYEDLLIVLIQEGCICSGA